MRKRKDVLKDEPSLGTSRSSGQAKGSGNDVDRKRLKMGKELQSAAAGGKCCLFCWLT